MEFQMQALKQSEWEKRVALENENTVLEEKGANMERLQADMWYMYMKDFVLHVTLSCDNFCLYAT